MKNIINIINKHELAFLFLLVVSVSALIKTPLLGSIFWRTPDGLEFLNVAENINQDMGLVQSIKWHFFDQAPVVTNALRGKPFMTGVVYAWILRFNNSYVLLQALNIFFWSLTTGLFYLLARKYLSRNMAFSAGILAALNPNILINSRLLLSEPFFYFLCLLSLLLLEDGKVKTLQVLLMAFASGIAFYFRFEAVFLALVIIIFIKSPRFKLVYLLFFIVLIAPYLWVNRQLNGSIIYSYNQFHYQVRYFSEGMVNINPQIDGVSGFILHNWSNIIGWIGMHLVDNIKSLLYPAFLGALTIFLFSKRKMNGLVAPIHVFSLLIVFIFSVTWSGFSEPERHLVIPYFSGILLVLSSSNKYLKSFVIAVFIFYLFMDVRRVVWVRGEEMNMEFWNDERKQELMDWYGNSDKVVAAKNPWVINMILKTPTVLIPKEDCITLLKLKEDYRVDYYILEEDSNCKNIENIYRGEGFYIYR